MIQRNALFEWKRYKPVGTDALVCPKLPTYIADRRGVCPYFEALSLIGDIYPNQLSLGTPPLGEAGWGFQRGRLSLLCGATSNRTNNLQPVNSCTC
ncbi:hypothetical protein [Prevotella veroralis]|uniref:hypothetical protein n=1 Tax=Prevotella veroralis TaxID=28137 RepID=UPI0012DEEB0E|nr:hypothetical protein [Prevotella veroralis]